MSVFCNSVNGGAVNTFISLIIKQLVVLKDTKLTSEQASSQTLLFNMIPGAVKGVGCTLIMIVFLMGVCQRYRFVYIILFSSLHVAAAFMLGYGAHSNNASNSGINTSLAGTYIYNWSVEVAQGGIVSLLASNSQGRTKKIFVSAIVVVAEGLGNIIGPRVIFKNADRLTQGWTSGRAAMGALSVIAHVALCALFFVYYLTNRIRDKKNEKLPEGADPDKLTDKENPEFRYHL